MKKFDFLRNTPERYLRFDLKVGTPANEKQKSLARLLVIGYINSTSPQHLKFLINK